MLILAVRAASFAWIMLLHALSSTCSASRSARAADVDVQRVGRRSVGALGPPLENCELRLVVRLERVDVVADLLL